MELASGRWLLQVDRSLGDADSWVLILSCFLLLRASPSLGCDERGDPVYR